MLTSAIEQAIIAHAEAGHPPRAILGKLKKSERPNKAVVQRVVINARKAGRNIPRFRVLERSRPACMITFPAFVIDRVAPHARRYGITNNDAFVRRLIRKLLKRNLVDSVLDDGRIGLATAKAEWK